MKKILYFLSVMLFVFSSCTNEIVDSDRENIMVDNKVNVKFTLNDLPDFEVVTRAASETEIASVSLMTFDEEGNFLGRVEAKMGDRVLGNDGAVSGSGSALVPLNTSTIHFVANYKWQEDQYVKPNGETESMMSSLTSGIDNFYVAWGVLQDINLEQTLSVTMKRNYAKVTVESRATNFEVAGFALSNYVNKGAVTYKGDELNLPHDFKLAKLSGETAASGASYLYEYENPYGSQTAVIIKNKDNQYFKILLTENKTGRPYKIQRNYEYHVVIEKIEKGVNGSSSYEAAVEAEPTNDIFAEVIKRAPTVSDKDKNRLTVDPVYCLFTDDGELAFSANFFKKGSSIATNSEITVTLIHNGHQDSPILPNFKEETVVTPDSKGRVTTRVNLPSDREHLKLDSAMLKVKAGMLSRIVTVMISKIYSFNTQSVSYSGTIDNKALDLKFTVPTFPRELFPLKCYILADGLNPVKDASTKPLLVEQRNNKVYYVYEINDDNYKPDTEVSLKFKAISSGELSDPTIENEYFYKGTFNMQMTGKSEFTNVKVGTVYYEKGSTIAYTFTAVKAATVSITGDNIIGQTVSVKADETKTVNLVTTKAGASGSIMISAPEYSNKTVSYTNSYLLKDKYSKNISLKYGYGTSYWNLGKNVALTLTPSGVVTVKNRTDGGCTIEIPKETSLNADVTFSCTITGVNYNASMKVSDLLNGSPIKLAARWSN